MKLQETWKDIKNFEGLYQVSNLGRVKSLARKAGFIIRKEHIIKSSVKENGYLKVNLYKDNKCINKNVHRLVAEAFIPNPNNYPCINHIDYNKANNIVDNIEWCSYAHNNKYSNCQIKAGKSTRIPILQYTKDGVFIKEWASATEASKILKLLNSPITACCKGRAKTAYGYVWKYK